MKWFTYNIFLQKRNYVMMFLMFGWIMLILLRVNLSICLVSMRTINTPTDIYSKETKNDSLPFKEDVFQWTPFEEGIILSSFSWGYVLSPMGGVLSSKFGGVKVFGLGVLFTAILTIISPFLIKRNYLIYLGGRFLEGVFQGFSSASLGEIFFQWTFEGERIISTNIVYLGYTIGCIVSYPFVGYLTDTFSWEATFYITGAIAIIWTLVWITTVAETPAEDKFIGKNEKDKFEGVNTHENRERAKHPWKEILTSKPLWALLNENFIMAWSSSFVEACVPLYIQDVHNTNMEEIGWLSSVPFYFQVFGKIPCLYVAKYLLRNRQFSKTTVHKMFILSAQIGTITSFTVAAVTHNFTISICAFAFFQLIFAQAFVSYNVIPIDIGGCHCSIVYGLCASAESIGSILNPIIIGLVVTNHTFAEWSRYFIILALLNGWAVVVFSRYGSGELQPWAVQNENKLKHDAGERTE